jgi:hypothetical protein
MQWLYEISKQAQSYLTAHQSTVHSVLFGILLLGLLWGPVVAVLSNVVQRVTEAPSVGTVLVSEEAPHVLHARRRRRMQERQNELKVEGNAAARAIAKDRFALIKAKLSQDPTKTSTTTGPAEEGWSLDTSRAIESVSDVRASQDHLYSAGIAADASRIAASLRRDERRDSALARGAVLDLGEEAFEIVVRIARDGSTVRWRVQLDATLQMLMDWLELHVVCDAGIEGMVLALSHPVRVLCSWRDFRVLQRPSGFQSGLEESAVCLEAGDTTLGGVGVTGRTVLLLLDEQEVAARAA